MSCRGSVSPRWAAILVGSGALLSCESVSVIPVEVASVAVEPIRATLAPGTTLQLTATALDASARPLLDRAVSWNSDDPSVASVDPSGLVTAHGEGEVLIRAASGGIEGTATIEVHRLASPATSTITADPTAIPVGRESTSTITVRLKDAQGNDLGRGGDDVTLRLSGGGTLSEVTDLEDGTYTATLTAPLLPASTTIRGTVNGEEIEDSATVQFTLLESLGLVVGGAAVALTWASRGEGPPEEGPFAVVDLDYAGPGVALRPREARHRPPAGDRGLRSSCGRTP